MASKKSPLTVIQSPTSIDELDDIWRWNARRYGFPHADDYLTFLRLRIADLASTYAIGKTVGTRPALRYTVAKRRAGGHGHVVVYSFDDNEVHILHVFHSAQDWENILADESE